MSVATTPRPLAAAAGIARALAFAFAAIAPTCTSASIAAAVDASGAAMRAVMLFDGSKHPPAASVSARLT